MDAARQEAQHGAAEGTIVLAGEQTAGRGRRGRDWFSPPGSLALTLVLRPRLSQLPGLIMVASLGVVRAIEALTPLGASIKWPNDVLVGGKKVCGILVESDLRGGEVDFALLGLGLNVNVAPALFSSLAVPATSLSAETGKELSLPEVLVCLLLEIERLYRALKAGTSPLEEWRRRLETLGQRVRIEGEGMAAQGVAEDVGSDGSLLLRQEDGSLTAIVAGEVSLRPL